MKLACIDCGSHSTRLLISEVDTDSKNLKTLHRDTKVTQLSKGVTKTNRLSEDGILRSLDCIGDYLKVINDFEIDPSALRIVATQAARQAENRDDFFTQIKKISSVEPDLLDGNKEAELGFLGATQSFNPPLSFQPPYLSIDIGGGSTEFGFGTTTCEHSISLDIGSVSLTEKYIAHDPAQPEELYAGLSVVETYLSDLVQEIPDVFKVKTLIGMAGTITTAAAVELGYYDPEKVHHFRLSIEAIEDVFRTLSIENRAQRLANPGLHPERVDVIVAGLIILVKTMRFFNFKECVVSETDLLEGVILDMINN